MVPFAGISDNAKVQEYWKALKVGVDSLQPNEREFFTYFSASLFQFVVLLKLLYASTISSPHIPFSLANPYNDCLSAGFV